MAAQRVTSSKGFWAGSREDYPFGRGVVVIQGRHIYHEPAIIGCSAARIWLNEEIKECIRQVIMLNGDWHLPADATKEEEDEFVIQQCAARGGKLMLYVEHANESAA